MKGNRKIKDAYYNGALLLVGLGLAGYFGLTADIYFAFVAGVIGKAGAFAWGNAKEYEHSKSA